MDKICDYDKCYGCGACSGACPVDCITLVANKEDCGHIHPVINNNNCINCGRCQKVCPANYPEKVYQTKECYAGYYRGGAYDASSSGGIAWALTKHTINNGGVAYGAAVEYGEEITVKHIRVNSESELYRLQGSKYVQSSIDRNIYKNVLSDLKSDKDVVFFGTGCQIAALKSFLGREYSNLLTVDIICHGVPSLEILNDYIKSINQQPSQIRYISFRQKDDFSMRIITYANKGYVIPLKNSTYIQGFMKALFYRESCYTCPYAHPKRGGDITLGDFWGLKSKLKGDPSGKKSISVILVNTKKGENKFRECTALLDYEARDAKEAIDGNPQLRFPSKKHFAHNIFKFICPILGYKVSSSITLIRERLFYKYALPFYYKHFEKYILRINK